MVYSKYAGTEIELQSEDFVILKVSLGLQGLAMQWLGIRHLFVVRHAWNMLYSGEVPQHGALPHLPGCLACV